MRKIYKKIHPQVFILSHLLKLLRPLEDIICFNFISTITGGHICSDHDQNLLSLPARLGGFGIPIKRAPKPDE